MPVFSIDLAKVSDWKKFNNLMNDIHLATEDHAQEEAKRLSIDIGTARNVIYLRSRSRWTPEKELKLIELSRQGIHVNIMEWNGEEIAPYEETLMAR